MEESVKFYVKCYDIGWDLTYQVEVDERIAKDVGKRGEITSQTPFPGIPIFSRRAGERAEQMAERANHMADRLKDKKPWIGSP
jgi:hypothetical protein